jgi:preprotein translocase subunit SecG
MESVLLVIHLFLALAIIGLVLLQRSEGGGLGIGGGGGGLGGLATARGTANALSRATAICATCFFITSLLLGIFAGQHGKEHRGLIDAVGAASQAEAPAEAGSDSGDIIEAPSVEEVPAVPPSAPLTDE